MTTIVYRDATPAEAETLAAIGRRTFATTFEHLYRPADLAAFFAQYHTVAEAERLLADPAVAVRFACAGEDVAGYAVVTGATLPHTRPERRTGELKRFYLLPSLHGLGVGDVLLGWACDEARARGYEDMALSVFSENPRAIRFYERHGFAFAGPTVFMVGEQADDEYIYRRAL